jgi:hypothetical protein
MNIDLTEGERSRVLYLLATDLHVAKARLKDSTTRLIYGNPYVRKLEHPRDWYMPDFKIRWRQAYAAKQLFDKFADAWGDLL